MKQRGSQEQQGAAYKGMQQQVAWVGGATNTVDDGVGFSSPFSHHLIPPQIKGR